MTRLEYLFPEGLYCRAHARGGEVRLRAGVMAALILDGVAVIAPTDPLTPL
jgi:hypothetical protein